MSTQLTSHMSPAEVTSATMAHICIVCLAWPRSHPYRAGWLRAVFPLEWVGWGWSLAGLTAKQAGWRGGPRPRRVVTPR